MVMLIAFALYYVYALVTASKFHLRVAGPLVVAAACFFGGVGLGNYLESGEGHSEHASSSHHGSAEHGHDEHAVAIHEAHDSAGHETAEPTKAKLSLVSVDNNTIHDVLLTPAESVTPQSNVNQSAMAGLFFGIYYCMTGVHAVHILGGMLVITWLIVKASREEFHSEYFGPVDNVGLYWHLVDFIWIYLFPLLYLIT
jgi:cytochrome c oxidase subunit 3